MGSVSIASFICGTTSGFLFIFVFKLPSYGFIMAYSVKFLVEILFYSVILYCHSKFTNNTNQKNLIHRRVFLFIHILKTLGILFLCFLLPLLFCWFTILLLRFCIFTSWPFQINWPIWVLMQSIWQSFRWVRIYLF